MYRQRHDDQEDYGLDSSRRQYWPTDASFDRIDGYEDIPHHPLRRNHSGQYRHRSPGQTCWQGQSSEHPECGSMQKHKNLTPVRDGGGNNILSDRRYNSSAVEWHRSEDTSRNRSFQRSNTDRDLESTTSAIGNMTIAHPFANKTPTNCHCCNHAQSDHRSSTRNVNGDCLRLHMDSKRAGCVSFPAASAKLKEVTKNAINFFGPFEANFETEVLHLVAYGSQRTIRSAWQDKILRNERHHDKPKNGWRRQGTQRQPSGKADEDQGQGMDWSGENHNAGNADPDDHDRDEEHSPDKSLTTFGEHQSMLKRSIDQLLDCQILEPKLRHNPNNYSMSNKDYGPGHEHYLENDDYTEPEDVQSMMEYNTSHQLLKRVHHCKPDLLSLLDKIRDDRLYMKRLLIELHHLAGILDSYNYGVGAKEQGAHRER